MLPEVLAPPQDPHEWPEWRRQIEAWRRDARKGYDDSHYRLPRFAWTARCYSCALLMMWDAAFYDARRGRFKVEELVKSARRTHGGYDAVVLWHAYPRIGFDDRNQFDYYRGWDGGLDELAEVVRRFQVEGVRVFVDYNPWDTGTRREPKTDAEALGELTRRIGSDGVFLDTLSRGDTSLPAAMPNVAFESELALPIDGIASHHLSWAQWFADGEAPGVLRNRWFERRHMMHLIRRWDDDHSGELQMAWMNGAGMLVWENVFGSWVGWSKRNRDTLRAMLPIQRAMHRFFVEGEWTPLVPCTAERVYASEWRLGDRRLWTIVNRSDRAIVGGPLMTESEGGRTFDLVAGKPISRSDVSIPPRGIGCLLSTPIGSVDEGLRSLLAVQAGRVRSDELRKPVVRRVRPPDSKPAAPIGRMARIEGGRYSLTTRFRVRECGEEGYAGFGGQSYPPLHSIVEKEREVRVEPFAIDEREVTNEEYDRFLASRREPPRERPAHEPAVDVDLEEARAYAAWVGKRLPTESEWQIAASQGVLRRAEKPVWEWTESEHFDGHTRFCFLKGGSWYRAEGSDWYADGGVREPEFAAKFICMCPSLDRSPTIGFRCAATVA
ncbi:MAG TPA: SUMF1/EgtB/PvdO family nonheme iron enzyme [Fimbriimonas sp.]